MNVDGHTIFCGEELTDKQKRIFKHNLNVLNKRRIKQSYVNYEKNHSSFQIIIELDDENEALAQAVESNGWICSIYVVNIAEIGTFEF